jgi:hypothetical protein
MVAPTFLQNNFFMYLVLPFLLLFAVMFAILQKTEIFGKGKKQVDALVAMAVALIVVAFANYVDVIIQMVAFLGVAIVIILVFLILTGAFHEEGKFKLDDWVKKAGMGLAALGVLIAVLVYTGAWNYIIGFIKSGDNSGSWVMNIIFLVVIIAAVVAVAASGGKGDKEKKE